MPYMIGGSDKEEKASPFAKKAAKRRSMIGGPEEPEAEEPEAEMAPEMDGKEEAAAMLARALGVPSDRAGRIAKALEAFVYACSGE